MTTHGTSATFLSRGVALVVFLAAATACSGAAAPTPSSLPSIALDVPADSALKAAIVVKDVAPEDLAKLRRTEMTRDQWSAVLRVSLSDDQPAVLGDYAFVDNTIRFTPMFPFDPGRQYKVEYVPARLVATVALPASNAQPSTVVSHVYPSGDAIPENQLRMYVHFSAPMGLKGGLDYVRLLNARGETVVDPFLPLDTEFWNDDRTRYTVFFDPGRQKRGITPNQQMGRSLVPGQRYTLVVDREWRDANGLPLKESFRREFRVGPADERPLDTGAWRVAPPPAGTHDPLVVTFPEALDHGLLLRAMGVAKDAQTIPGEIRIDASETRWSFTPRDAWRAGTYQLVALGMLEDLAGNRIGRAFEVDRFDRADPSREPSRVHIPFTVNLR